MFTRNKDKNRGKHKRPSFWSREKLISVSLFGAKKPDITIPDTPPPAPGLSQPPRVAVVLGGGGARGFAHVGVLKILQEAGIPIDLVVGTSVGSLIGALFCDNHKAEHLEEEIKKIKPKDLLDLAIFRLRSGIFTGNALQNFLLNRLEAKQFSELKTKLVVTAVDISTSDVVTLESGPIAPAVNASCALPPFFHPVDLYGYHLVDGGVIDPVPVAVAKMYQPKIVVAVDVTPGVVIHWPRNLLTRFVRSYNFSLAELGQLHARQSDIIIAPKVGDTDIFDFTRKMQMYEAGILAAQQKLYDLKQAISQKIETIP